MQGTGRKGSSLTRRRVLLGGLKASLATGAAALGGAGFTPAATAATLSPPAEPSQTDRTLWLEYLEKVANPVLLAASRRELRQSMPVEAAHGHEAERAVGTHLEALGRLLAGMAPWLELEPSAGETAHETQLRKQYRSWATAAITSAVDPASPDYMRFGQSAQTLVDSSFLALALLRAPKQLRSTLPPATLQHLVTAIESERTIEPPFSNWLLFAAMNEALLRDLGASWDRLRVDYALRELSAWYVGDGTYGDGPQFHADFYNSYVIQPYLLMLIGRLGNEEPAWKSMAPAIGERARRYAAIQERVISPTGEFPVLGRSITYRAGAFHLLADAALRDVLPEGLAPAAVRGALTAVQRRTLTPPGTFDTAGWLQIGLAGHQPALGETYISTGSLYLCSAAWLPLGLPPAHAFWAAPAAPWTQKAVWAGEDRPADHALGR